MYTSVWPWSSAACRLQERSTTTCEHGRRLQERSTTTTPAPPSTITTDNNNNCSTHPHGAVLGPVGLQPVHVEARRQTDRFHPAANTC